jgi:uncharacterized membrane protein YkgB
MRSLNTPAGGLTLAGTFVMRPALTANLLWIGALKFKRYEVENIEPLVTSSPLPGSSLVTAADALRSVHSR